MKAALLIAKKTFELKETTAPTIADDEVLIKILYTGICGSDIHVYNGEQHYPYPVALGHEIVGTVSQIGKQVDMIKLGDRVTLLPSESCGECDFCRQGKQNLCDNIKCIGEMQENGGFAEFIKAKSNMVYEIPAELSFEEAALIEPVAAAHYIAQGISRRTGRHARIGIFGMGTIGLLVLQMLKKVFGFQTVYGFDILDFRLDRAKKFGADVVFNIKNPFPDEWPTRSYDSSDLYKTGLFDLLVDCAAVPESLNGAVKLAKKGGTVVLVGEPSGAIELDIVTLKLIVLGEITIAGSMQYLPLDFERAIEILKQKRIDVDSMISKIVHLENVQEAFEDYISHKNEQIKILVRS